MNIFKNQQDAINREENELNEFNNAIQFGEKSLLLFATAGGIYQIISGHSAFYFKRVGGELKGIYPGSLITDFSDESRYLTDKKDFFILKNDITKISINQRHSGNCPLAQSGQITIESNKKKRHYVILNEIDIKTVEKFFKYAVNAQIKMPAKIEEWQEETLSEEEAKNLPMLRKVGKILMYVSYAALLIFGFALTWLPSFMYLVSSIFCIMIPIAALIIYFKYNGVVSIADPKKSKNYSKNHVFFYIPLLVPAGILTLRAFIDFSIVNYKLLIILSILTFVVILTLFFIFSKEYKERKSAIVMIIFFALIFAPGFCVHINNLNYGTPSYVSASVYDKEIHEGSKTPTTYHLKLTLSNGDDMDVKVVKQDYNNINEGSTVYVAEYKGLLSITIAELAMY